MRTKNKSKQRICGNCGSHTAYEYPTKIFCSARYSRNKNPIMEIFSCCEDWNPSSQECYCVEEATKKQK